MTDEKTFIVFEGYPVAPLNSNARYMPPVKKGGESKEIIIR
jgi:hypothetical protein